MMKCDAVGERLHLVREPCAALASTAVRRELRIRLTERRVFRTVVLARDKFNAVGIMMADSNLLTVVAVSHH
jgi:hypothetical protein